MDDDSLKELSARIYRQHKVALDLIYRYRPNRASQVRDVIKEWVSKRAEENLIIHNKEMNDTWYIRFLTPEMSKLIPNADVANSSWNTRNHYYYEIVIDSNDEKFRITLCLNYKNASKEQIELFKKIHSLYKPSENMRRNMVYDVFKMHNKKFYFGDNDDDTDIEDILDQQLDNVFKFERNLVEKLK